MLKPVLAAIALALSTSVAFAASDNAITTKAMGDHPGTKGGSTAAPTSKPDTYSLSAGQMSHQPGVSSDHSGTTATPNAKPEDGSIAGKEMTDAPGARK